MKVGDKNYDITATHLVFFLAEQHTKKKGREEDRQLDPSRRGNFFFFPFLLYSGILPDFRVILNLLHPFVEGFDIHLCGYFQIMRKIFIGYIRMHISHFWKVGAALAFFHTLNIVVALLTCEFPFEVP